MDSLQKLDKREWRNAMRKMRRTVSPAERDAAGHALASGLLAWPLLRRDAYVATFLSLAEEVPTDAINAALYAAGFRLAVPVWSSPARRYRFVEWSTGEALTTGPMRVPEPAVKRYVTTESIDVFLVPGLAFDHAGGRIGYGAGHYDRMLAERKATSLCLALGYDWQLVKELPQGPDDIRMDWVLTPGGAFNVKS